MLANTPGRRLIPACLKYLTTHKELGRHPAGTEHAHSREQNTAKEHGPTATGLRMRG